MSRRLDIEPLRQEAARHVACAVSGLDMASALGLIDQATGHVHALKQLRDHLAEHADALTSGDSGAPLSHQRLTRLLVTAGFGEVRQPQCARCGQAKNLANRVRQGRVCSPCYRQLNHRPCARCGRVSRVAGTTAEGPICDNCYFHDHTEPCAACGQPRPVNGRRPDGSPLCAPCNRPRRPCGACGRVVPIKIRGRDGKPDLCHSCHLGDVVACSACGRLRPCTGVRAGRPVCRSCSPRKARRCAHCGRTGLIMARWPVGAACKNCYRKIRENPQQCPACHRQRALIGLDETGARVCGPCGGYDATYECTACGRVDDSVLAGLCLRCALTTRAREILTCDGAGPTPQMQRLLDLLDSVDNPRSMLVWLTSDHGGATEILRALARAPKPITHTTLDGLPQTKALRHIRDLLVLAGALPTRNENLERVALWLDSFLSSLPRQHSQLLRPYTHWSVLRQARRRASQGRFTPASARYSQRNVTAAARFLTWLDDNKTTPAELTQGDVDRWLDGCDCDRYTIRRFLTWAAQQGLAPGGLRIPEPPRPQTPTVIDEQQRLDQLRHCVHDTNMPLDVRVAGILVLLYGQPASKIVQLTADHIRERDTSTHLALDRCPILIPPTVADLLIQLRDTPCFDTSINRATAQHRWLFPGLRPGQPIHPTTLVMKMNAHGITTRASRQAALMTYASQLPSPVLADLLRLHLTTAIRWAALAKRDWTSYIAARHTTPTTNTAKKK